MSTIKDLIKYCGLFVAIIFSTSAHSVYVPFDVSAVNHSSSVSNGVDGTGLNTGLNYNAGDIIDGFTDPNDLWNAGKLPRWSNADGLVVDLFATGSDESGESSGTQIGAGFGDWTQHGLTAPFGSLVGEINNTYFLLGTNFNIAAPDSGLLSLYYWDSNAGDNEDQIRVSINDVIVPASEPGAVPIPATAWLFISGLIGLISTRKRS